MHLSYINHNKELTHSSLMYANCWILNCMSKQHHYCRHLSRQVIIGNLTRSIHPSPTYSIPIPHLGAWHNVRARIIPLVERNSRVAGLVHAGNLDLGLGITATAALDLELVCENSKSACELGVREHHLSGAGAPSYPRPPNPSNSPPLNLGFINARDKFNLQHSI